MDQDAPAGSADQSRVNAADLSVIDPPRNEFGMSVEQVVRDLRLTGGTATRSQLLDKNSRGALKRSVASGLVLRTGHGRYALAQLDEARRVAHALSGVLCLASAALRYGWTVKVVPDRPQVWVPRNRRMSRAQHSVADIHRQRLYPDDIAGGVTTKVATLRDCLRQLPEDEALAIADSALRSGEFAALRHAAITAQGSGSARVRRIAAHASADAANPFESVLRSIVLRVPGLAITPRHLITAVEPWARVDLADIDRRIVMEADSFEWHGKRERLRSDCRRYDDLVADGWTVLRFAWEDVMFEQDWIESVLRKVVALSDRRTELPIVPIRAA